MAAAELAPFDILHLSHGAEIDERLLDGRNVLRDRYGAKGSGLIRISHAGIPTRDGFLLPTHLGGFQSPRERFRPPRRGDPRAPRDPGGRHRAARGAALRFGDAAQPLLLAIRGGSVFSMPGILPTVVFAGINDEVAESLAGEDPWYASTAIAAFSAPGVAP